MIKDYLEVLPEYLRGENISKHAKVINKMNNDAYNKLYLLSTWSNINRPILFERVQTSDGECTITVHVDMESPIRSISISGDITETITFDEDEVVTSHSITRTVTSEDIIVMPILVVEVESIDGICVTKGYPENDTVTGDVYDHDEFLDLMGNLFNVPRHVYKEYSISDVSNSYPPYMGKSVSGGMILSCTEDDYYYQQRLKSFFDNLSAEDLAGVMLKVRYGISDLSSVSLSSVISQISNADLPSVFKTNGELDISKARGYLLYVIGEGQEYSNLFSVIDDYSQITDGILLHDEQSETKLFKFLENYTPITRLPVITKVRTPILTLAGTIQSNLGLQARLLRNASGSPLANVPLRATLSYIDGTSETVDVVTAGNGVATIWTEKILGTESIQFTLQSPLYKDIQNNIREYSIDDIELIWNTEEAWTNASLVILNNETKMRIINGGYLKTMFPLISNYSLRYTVIPRSTGSIRLYVGWIFAGQKIGYSIPYSYEQNKEYDIEVLLQEDILYFFAKGVFLKSFTARDSYFGVNRWFTTNDYVSDVSFGLSEYTGVPRYISDENMWTFISRDTSSTDPVITEEGVIQLGKNTHHIYEEEQLNPAKRYIIHFYKQNENNTYLGMGVTGTTRPPSSSDGAGTNINRGVISGNNTAKIYYEGNTWKIQFNDATPVSLNKNNDETRYIYFVTTTASNYAEVYSIFTEEP